MAENRPLIHKGEGNQGGDESYGDLAGGNIYKQGIPPEVLLRHLDGERQSRDAFAAALERLWLRVDEMQREQRERDKDAALERGIDFDARVKRQFMLDTELSDIKRGQQDLRKGQTTTRWIIFWVAVGVLFAVAVALWLAYDRFSALAFIHDAAGGLTTYAHSVVRRGR